MLFYLSPKKLKIITKSGFLYLLQFLTIRLHKIENEAVVFSKSFFHYSGLKFIYRKFVPADDKTLPTGIIWLIGLYFAVYAFTSQRYEFRLDKIEYRYSIFTTQLGAGSKFSNHRLLEILNETIPIEPSIYNPISIFKSFLYGFYFESFYQNYTDVNKVPFKSASAFRQEIICDWNQNLNEANFIGAQLEGTYFGGAQLKGAYFISAHLEMADFRGAQLEGAYFKNAQLNGAYFKDAKLERTYFNSAQLNGAIFNDAQLEEAIFRDAQLEKASFQGAQLKRVFFNAAQLKEANLTVAQLKGVDFNGAQLEGANFSYSQLEEVNFSNTQLEGANFMFAVGLTGKQLINADNIYGIKNCPRKALEEIKKYGCEIMLITRPDEWPTKFKKHREVLRAK